MRQLLRLLTALMLLFGLCQMILAQRRGTTRYISSPNPNANNWESQMISGIMNRADIGSNTVQQPRRQRQYGRIINGRTSTTTAWSAIETISLESSTDKVPVYRVRGRNQSKLQSIESERIKSPTTGKPTRRKLYQEKQRLKTEPVSSTISSRDEFEPKTKPNPHIADNQRHTYSNLNRTATRKTTNGRRYRIRVVEGNQGNEITTKITKTATTTAAALGTKSSTTTAANDSNKTAATSPDRDAVIEEQNYPEHFKALLKSKKSPSVLPSLSTYAARSNAFILPKEQIQSLTTTVPTPPQPENSEESIITPDYIQQKSAILVSSAANEHDETVTDYYNTKTSAPAIPSTTTSKAQISTKHIGGLKFSSKLRSMNFDEQQSPIPIFRTWTTPHASTLKDPLQLISNHRYSTLPVLDAPKFSARYKSGEITSSLATYRKNLMREKPPFYTPTTPPITTQMNEIDWAASDYSYHYNDVEPVHSGLMQSPPLNVETSHHSSSSMTVSIFGALSEILSHTTESLSFLTSITSTESPPQSHTHGTFLHSTFDADVDLKPIQKFHSATATAKHKDQTIHKPRTKQQHNEISEPIDSNEELASFISSTTTSTPSFKHTASNEQVDAIFNSNIQNQNQKHSNSTNIKIRNYNIHNNYNKNNNNGMTTKPTTIQRQSSMPTLIESIQNHNPTHVFNESANKTAYGILIVLANSTRNDKQFKHENVTTTQPLKTSTNSDMIETVQFNVSSSSPMYDASISNVNIERKLKSHHSNLTNSSMNISMENVMPIYPVYETTTIQSSKANRSITISSSIERPTGVDLLKASKAKLTKIKTYTKAMTDAKITSTMASLMTTTKSITTTTSTTEQSVNIFNSFDKINLKIPKNTNINDPIVNNEPNLPNINQKPLTNTPNEPIESTTSTERMTEFTRQIVTTNVNVVNMTFELEVFNRQRTNTNATNMVIQTTPRSTKNNEQVIKLNQINNYDEDVASHINDRETNNTNDPIINDNQSN